MAGKSYSLEISFTVCQKYSIMMLDKCTWSNSKLNKELSRKCHIFLCRKKQNHDIYDEVVIPNRWRKEFEPAHDDTEIHIVHVNRNQ